MPPRTQHATTSDRVSIAYWVLGDGPPLVYLPAIPGHAQLDWERPQFRRLYEWLAGQHRLIRIDARNTGLSQRGVRNLSIEARQLDLEAVADRLGLGDFVLFGHGGAASTAIGFSALHPARVRRLILVDAAVGFPDIPETPAVEALRTLVNVDWQTYTEMLAAYMSGWSAGDESRALAALLRRSQTWDDSKHSLSTLVYASALIPRVAAPTLVAHHNDAIVTAIETGRRLAREIADAQLVSLEGSAVVSTEIDSFMMAAVDDFLSDDDDLARTRLAATAPPSAAGGSHEEEASAPRWHVFISHASEDKDAVARPLARLLEGRGLHVWLDENELRLGDSLRESIDHGLANSRYGVVILSKSFFAKEWTTRELNGLSSLESGRRKVLLPVWHEVDREYVSRFSPVLADKMAVSTTTGLDGVADAIMRVIESGDNAYRAAN